MKIGIFFLIFKFLFNNFPCPWNSNVDQQDFIFSTIFDFNTRLAINTYGPKNPFLIQNEGSFRKIFPKIDKF